MAHLDRVSGSAGGLPELAAEDLWREVQQRPDEVTFPGGEAMADMAARAVACVREWDAALRAEHGDAVVRLVLVEQRVQVAALHLEKIGVRLTELRPDGKERYVQNGWLRASHRALDPARATVVVAGPYEEPDRAAGT